jgi:protein-S-isoprenylcysteine O-methyltransferase Ste14
MVKVLKLFRGLDTAGEAGSGAAHFRAVTKWSACTLVALLPGSFVVLILLWVLRWALRRSPRELTARSAATAIGRAVESGPLRLAFGKAGTWQWHPMNTAVPRNHGIGKRCVSVL